MLKEIQGTVVEALPFANLRLLADLIYFDGPLLAYFQDNAGQDYLYYWCDADEQSNRWLVFPTTQQSLGEFFTQQLSLHGLIVASSANPLYWVDMNQDAHVVKVMLVSLSALPDDYLPDVETYYDASLTLFHEEQIARDLLVLMQQSLQEAQRKLRKIEEILVYPPQPTSMALAVV